MAKDKTQSAPPTRKTIDEWLADKHTKPYVHAAVVAANNWAQGKLLTESEYDEAVADWLSAPMGGRR